MTTPRVDRIIVGITGTLANLAALHAAVEQARRSAVPLVAIHTWLPVGGEVGYHRDPCAPLVPVWRQQARNTLACAFIDAFGTTPADIDVELMVLRGEAGPTLVAAAYSSNDLLVVGSGRRGPFAGLRYGSVSRYCFTHARCPVLAVPPPALISELRSQRTRRRTHDALSPSSV